MKFNRLLQLKFSHIDDRGYKNYWFKCDCGSYVRKRLYWVKIGHIKSCGCAKMDAFREMMKTRRKKIFHYNGEEMTYYGLQRVSGVDQRTLRWRIEKNQMPLELAISKRGQIREKWKMKLGWENL